jgi:hypothetical protein
VCRFERARVDLRDGGDHDNSGACDDEHTCIVYYNTGRLSDHDLE